MNTDNLNMMNLLLGSLPQASDLSMLEGSKPGGEIPNAGFDLIFDQLMMSLGGDEAVINENGSTGLINDSNPAELLAATDQQQNLIEGDDAINSKEVASLKGNPETNEYKIINNLPVSLDALNEINGIKYDNSIESIEELAGKFEVKNWNIVGNNVNIELVSNDNPDTVLKVSLPIDKIADQLLNNKVNVNSALERISLDGQKVSAPNQLKELLEKYDIKEIQINTAEIQKDTVQNKNLVDVEIFAQNAGQEVVLKSKLNKNAIQIKDKSIDKKILNLDSQSNRVGLESEQSLISPVRKSIQNSSMNLMLSQTVAEKLDAFNQFSESSNQAGQDMKSDNLNQLPNFIKSPTEMVLTKDKVDLQPVRFTLPDNINAQLKPNGKSVRINIEPYNLGPAKLNLNMQNDKLSAVVTVHSAQAKMTVEGSLDKLLDSLHKADIQVDYIDVNVSQDNGYEQFSQQRTAYRGQQMNQGFSLSEYLNNEEPLIENRLPIGVSYVNATGVNLTA